jgi:thiol:disulfide interchange protein DsbD
MNKFFNQCLLTAGLTILALSANAQVYTSDQIEVELISETTNVVAGETLWLGVRLKPIEHWHTYWKFGGDSGEATFASEWQLPQGAVAGDIVWPTPEWTPFEGTNLVTFTYEREVLLPIPVSIPRTLQGNEIEISTKIDWQVCDEICIPGDAVFNITLPVGGAPQIDTRWETAFAQTRSEVPIIEHNLTARFNVQDGKVNLMVDAGEDLFGDVDEAYFFTEQERVMKYAPYRDNMVEPGRLQISLEQHRRMPVDIAELNGVLALIDESGNQRSFQINATRAAFAWDHSIEVELLSESTNIVPGEETWLAIRLKANEGWHTYWKMGGDSGEATEATQWQAPQGTVVSDIQWPAPHWLPFPGSNLVNYGYDGEIILPISVTVPQNVLEIQDGEQVELATTVLWQVCELICIPGEQRLSLSLPIGEVLELDARNVALAEAARAELPVQDHDIEFIIAAAGERVSLGFQSVDPLFANVTDAWFFPEKRRVIANGPIRDVTIGPNLIQITHAQPRRMLEDLSEVYGVLVVADAQGNTNAYEFIDPAADANQITITPLATSSTDSSAGGGTSIGTLLGFMAAALLGGLILNLMPCVFPVLSIKALSFAANAGESARKQRIDGLVYTSGVIIAFLLLATVLIALRAGGELVGWGFQLQEPWFIALIIYLFFTMGLSLSGVFEIGTSLMNTGTELTENSHGYRRSFFTGVLATVVATPCTAPFMGPALGFALSQTWIVAMLVFIALGLGMALPILVLSFLPALARYMPKPGNWMVTFKEFMAFPLYATALYFLWVLGVQVGTTGMSLVLAACVLIAFASWLFKKRLAAGPFVRYANTGIAAACIVTALYVLQTPFMTPVANEPLALNEDGSVVNQTFEPFSAQRLEELQASGRPVFVNMTAAWCITCLANEQTTLSTDRVKQALADNDVTYLKGDWTNEDPEITAVLERFNRPSVPLYVLYPGDTSKEPTILPQILTPSIVVNAFSAL